jgi:hypothetical protein
MTLKKTLLALATLATLAVPAASMADPGRFHRGFDYHVLYRAEAPRPYERPRFFPAFTRHDVYRDEMMRRDRFDGRDRFEARRRFF